MPPELMELYNLYKQELETRNKKENQFVEELNNEIIRVWWLNKLICNYPHLWVSII